MKMMITGWARRKFLHPLKEAIKQGISAERLSVSLALGITLGLIPLYGITTILVGAIALSLRLNFFAMLFIFFFIGNKKGGVARITVWCLDDQIGTQMR